MGWWGDRFKRVFDVGAACALLVVFSPVFLALSLTLAIHLRGNPFFVHQRVTKNSRIFSCLKFRTMHDPHPHHQEEEHPDFKHDMDTRTTRFTSLLRRTSLDELPQLWNVLTGDMSLVGPRPIVPAEVAKHFGPRAHILLSVRPGMTGLWAVNGRSEVTYPERTHIELRYVMRLSMMQDVRIMLGTFRAVIGGKGAR